MSRLPSGSTASAGYTACCAPPRRRASSRAGHRKTRPDTSARLVDLPGVTSAPPASVTR
jgi:hypothetical protein